MGRRGPAPTPASLRLARGNPGHHKKKADEPEAAPLASREAPEYLKGNAKWLWDQLSPEAVRLGLLNQLSAHQFCAICEAFCVWRQYEGLCEEVGPQLAVQMGYRNAADRSREAFIKFGSRFGLDPASISSVKATPPRDESEEVRARFFGVAGKKKS